MQKRFHLLGICLVLFCCLAGTAPAETISVVSDPWCPYNCAKDSDKPGYMIEILKVIFSKAGHEIRYDNMPWTRCLDHLKKGKIDAVVGATRGEAEGAVFPDEEFGFTSIGFFVKKGNPWRFKNIDSLKAIKIGIQSDYEYGPGLDDYFEANRNTSNVQEVSNDQPLVLNIRKLVMGRIDMVPEDQSVFLYTSKEMGVADQVELAGKRPILTTDDFESGKIYVAFAPGKTASETYAKIFTSGINEMRASGELAKILAKYALPDWKQNMMEIKTQLDAR